MEFRVLGPLEVRAEGKVLPVRAQAVPSSVAANLRTHVARLRRNLSEADAGSRVVARSGGYLIDVRPGELDLTVFDELVCAGRQALRQKQHAVAARRFGEALALWHGDPLENVALCGAGEAEVARLVETRLSVVEERLLARLAAGEHLAVVGELRALTVAHPLREQLWALLMVALHRAGRQADALAAYEQARTRLADELGLDPGAELQRTHQQILTGDAALTAPPPPTAARCDLPGDIGDFTGRAAELTALLESPRRNATATVISAIDGMAGIGKTTLAVHLAHHLARDYPDGQLFLDLRAHTIGRAPLTPADALARLLRAMNVPGERIPEDVEDRAALWRATLADRRVVIVLDNATDSAQVRPLLPGTPGCLVVVTSRRRLAGMDGAYRMSLDVLAHDEAAVLFERVVGDPRPAGEPDAVAEVLQRCGHLPLAIRIAGARLRHRPSWSVGHLAGRLRDQPRRLSELQGDDRSVAAVFALSYQQLPVRQRRLFRLLSAYPGRDFDAGAAAAIADLPVAETERLLEDLFDIHLLGQPAADRYCLHDLVRAYGAQLVMAEDSIADQRAALTRLSDHYRHAVDAQPASSAAKTLRHTGAQKA